MGKKTQHVAQYKKETVKRLVTLMNEYPIVAALNMENMPAKQLQIMKAQLRGKAEIIMTKKRLIRVVIEKVKDSKKGIEQLEPNLKGMPALLFTKENPFKIYMFISKNKSPAPAKSGQEAPKDIIVPAGPTPFAPGPFIGELGALKIKTGVEGGKVVIKQDSIIVKKGEKVSQKASEVLSRLGIQPMEVGLDLVAVYENGEI